jgi:hypothetical protein
MAKFAELDALCQDAPRLAAAPVDQFMQLLAR